MINGALRKFLFLTGCLLCLQTICSIELDDILSLNIPVMVIGKMLYLDFSNNTLHKLYECLCDMQIIGCTIMHEQRGEKTSFVSLPGFFTVTNLLQTKALTDVTGQYKQVFMCNLPLSPQEMINCYRPTTRDKACEEDGNCVTYSVQTNSRVCSYSCSQMIWIGFASLSLEFYNFGDIPEPVENGVCPTPESTSTIAPTLGSTVSGNEISASTMRSNVSFTTGVNQNRSVVESQDPKFDALENSGESFSVLTPQGAAIGVSLLIVIAGVAYLFKRFSCHTDRSRSPFGDSKTGPESVESVSRCTSSPENHTAFSIDEPEEERYQTLEEVTAETGDEPDIAVSGDESYHTIRDCFMVPGEQDRCSRPLPVPPDTEAVALELTTFTESLKPDTILPLTFSSTSSAPSASTLSSIIRTSGINKDSVPSSLIVSNLRDTKERTFANRPKPIPRRRLIGVEKHSPTENQSSGSRPQPPPCRRLTDLDNHQHLGVVNFRRDHPALSASMQAKLIRTQWGDMELISVPEDLLAFTEYYSRLQLVRMRNNSNSLGVVGLSEELLDNDSHKYFDFSEVNKVDNHHDSVALNQIELNQMTQSTSKNKQVYPYVFYFGSLDLADEANVRSSDYLTVLDIDPSKDEGDKQGYLTVLDIDTSNVSNSSLYSLALLEE